MNPKAHKLDKEDDLPGKAMLVKPVKYMSFGLAIGHFINGEYIARSMWKGYYLNKLDKDGFLVSSYPDRWSMKRWVPKIEDFTCHDWYVI